MELTDILTGNLPTTNILDTFSLFNAQFDEGCGEL